MRPGRQVTDRLKICDAPAYLLSKTGVSRGKWTIHYWINHGKKSYTNREVKLKAEKICGQVFTRKVWIDAFLRELET